MPADAVDHHERLPARGARQGDRHLGRHGRDRHRPRPAVRRPAARVLRLDARSSSSTCPSSSSPSSPASRLVPESRDPRPGPLRPRRRAALDRRPRRARLRGHRGARARLDGPARSSALSAARRRSAPRSSPGSCARPSRCSTSRCSATRASASAPLAISLAFFALFGTIFALTQYLQDAQGYRALEAGAAMVPLAVGLVLGAGSSIKLVGAPRHHPRGAARPRRPRRGCWRRPLAWTPDMPYWPLGLWFFGVALSMGCIMGPATDSVMGAVPEEKAGVASAMNDVTRQVGGALGVAVIGSLVGSLYSSRVDDATAHSPRSKPRQPPTPSAPPSPSPTVCRQRRGGTRARRRERLHRRARARPPRRRRGGTHRRGRRLTPPACAPPAGGAGAEGAAGRRSGGRGHRGRLTARPLLRGAAR